MILTEAKTITLPARVVKYRIESIDILRGLIMLIMALDHVRDFFHAAIPANDPTNLATTNVFLFFTRWITHFCAPLFIFLSGISAHLAGTRRTKKELSLFLIKRGLWIIFIELVISFAHTLDPMLHLVIFQVIWAIGASMVILGLVLWLPLPVIAVIGGLIFFGHDILDYIALPQTGAAGFLWKLFFTAHLNFYHINQAYVLKLSYAIIPWTGVMMLGYVFGLVYRSSFDASRRRKILVVSGICLIELFLLLRAFNIYGDPVPWTVQGSTMLTILSFLNVSKYPPSLLYLCVTLGPGLLLLASLENVKNRLTDLFMLYGNVPFFYYVLHWYLLRALSIAAFYLSGYGAKDIVNPRLLCMFRPENLGYSLGGVYLVWLLVISILYFPCRWFSNYKKMHRDWWLSYL
jgi:uncharacterized membrane protein